ncbi:MAG: hypothetical protein WDO15_28410 [Bacteroidota bacterium]
MMFTNGKDIETNFVSKFDFFEELLHALMSASSTRFLLLGRKIAERVYT